MESSRPLDLALRATALIISNEEKIYILKMVKSLEESGLIIKGISERIKSEAKERKDGFAPMLLGTLAGGILGNSLTEKAVIRAGEGVIKSSKNFQCCLIV